MEDGDGETKGLRRRGQRKQRGSGQVRKMEKEREKKEWNRGTEGMEKRKREN